MWPPGDPEGEPLSMSQATVLNETRDRYLVTSTIGLGAYAAVFEAVDVQTRESVAVKCTTRLFETPIDTKRVFRELRILRLLDHPQMPKLLDIYLNPHPDCFEMVLLVIERMETDLTGVMRQNEELLVDHRQWFVWQILKGLKYIHSRNIMHRDLKPANILLNASCELKICDFGLARVTDPHTDEVLSEYVATRWYRAPEILFLYPHYSCAVDLWALGATLAELITRRPLFPGTSYMDQIEKIAAILGTPTEADLADCVNERALLFVSELQPRPPVPFELLFPDSPPVERDFLAGLLKWNPAERMTADQALAHPYVADLRVPEEELTGEPIGQFEFETQDATCESLAEGIRREVADFLARLPGGGH
jgi:serine/threonine protein kinase